MLMISLDATEYLTVDVKKKRRQKPTFNTQISVCASVCVSLRVHECV